MINITIRQKIKSEDDAVVGIIVTVLIIGLVITFISMIQVVYVPQWMEQIEAEHMQDVSVQFNQIKYSLDIQSMVNQSNSISSYITLGSKNLPILDSVKAYGNLEIFDDCCNISFIDGLAASYDFSLGAIEYSSGNTYFVDQRYIYEAGALILSQSQASILRSAPSISVSDFIYANLTIVDISGVEGKRFISGFGTFSTYFEFLDSTTYEISDVRNIIIKTDYPNAWYQFLDSPILKYSGFDYDINYIDNGLRVDFNNPDPINEPYVFFVRYNEISAQVAPGWIE